MMPSGTSTRSAHVIATVQKTTLKLWIIGNGRIMSGLENPPFANFVGLFSLHRLRIRQEQMTDFGVNAASPEGDDQKFSFGKEMKNGPQEG